MEFRENENRDGESLGDSADRQSPEDRENDLFSQGEQKNTGVTPPESTDSAANPTEDSASGFSFSDARSETSDPPFSEIGKTTGRQTPPYAVPRNSWSTGPFEDPYGYGASPQKKSGHGKQVLLFLVAAVFAFALGGGLMFCAIYTDTVSTVADFVRGGIFGWYSITPPQIVVPDEGEQDAPEEDSVEDELAPEEDEDIVQPFEPIDNAPFLHIVTVETEGENYREELDIPSIAELAQPSVVGVIKYVGEDPLEGYTIGSGTIFTADGYIITNEHVISDPYSITVLLNDGSEYEAKVVAADDDADIAILKIDAQGLTPAEFGDSTQLRVGEISVAIGCPASVDLQGTTTSGIISALDRVITVDATGKTMRLLQTDAAINPGNSGGPLLNKYGQVIGINTVKMTSSLYEGLCFAIPTSELESIVADLFTYGYVRGYPAIGIMASSVMAAEDEYGGAPSGVLVASVDSSSGAFGKVEVGDIITHCNGTEVVAVAQINTIKNRLKVGDTITLTIYRKGETFDVEIPLVDQYDLAGD